MPRLSRRSFVTTTVAAAAAHAAEFHSQWQPDLSRPWLGPEYWANPMQDWRIRNGRLECFIAGADRNVFLLTREVNASKGDLTMSVKLGRLEEDRQMLEAGFAGFRVGIKGEFHDYRDNAVHGVGRNAGITSQGRLFIDKPGDSGVQVPLTDGLQLKLTATPGEKDYTLTLEALDRAGTRMAQVQKSVPGSSLEGGVALVCHSGNPQEISQNRRNALRGGTMRFWFTDWTLTGTKVSEFQDRAFGPIYFAMHTLSRRVLKMTAQLAPLEAGTHEAELHTKVRNQWKTVAKAEMDQLARTVTFRIPDWDDTKDTPYRVVFGQHTWEGTVRKDPGDGRKLTIGALTCCNDVGFPHSDLTKSLKHFNADILFFTGDQIYEGVGGYGIQFEPTEQAALDNLRKWLMFGWSFREFFRDIPTICMPDDHDVYHGNVWGSAGKKAVIDPSDPETKTSPVQSWQDSGGYKMEAELVNMVQRHQTSHLPDPFDPTPVGQGIGVYYTSLLYGGVSFAIIEDRKWKSSPRSSVPWADIRNGWAQNPRYKAPQDGDVPGAELLGSRQLEFLEKWAQDWNGAYMKVLVSQTLWANLCTLPPPANTDSVTSKLPVLRPDQYAEGEVMVADHDSNGWPQTPRTRGLRAMRKAAAFHIGGDQHLGSTVRYGIDEFNDGPYMICTPAISNLFPRRWFPAQKGANCPADSPRYCGEYVEGFGNKITVHAVANPRQTGLKPAALYDRATGYGIVEVDRKSRRIQLANWARQVDATKPGAKPYPGWPITIHQYDNGISNARYALPEVKSPVDDPVVQVIDESNNQVAFTIRIQGRSFTPRVHRPGSYTVRLMPDKGKPQEWKGQRTT
ncbi:MAG: hypothetical protein U0R19_24235 [Bryobacteraceae bacterium]